VAAILILLVVACLAASLHALTGFGSALVLSPALLALEEPHVAVAAMVMVALGVNALIALRGPRSELVAIRPVLRLTPGAIVGLPVGLLLLTAVSKPGLEVLMGLVVLGAGIVQARNLDHATLAQAATPGIGSEAAVGLVSGALTSCTGIGVTPIVLWLNRRVPDKVTLRYGIAVYSILLTGGTAVLLGVTGDSQPLIRGMWLALALSPAVFLGHWLGRSAFVHIEPRQFRVAMLVLVMVSGAASVLVGLS
jgi:uncharacterized membrane protein YfcA